MALTTVSTEGIKNGTIKDEDVKSDAAIAGSKIAPAFTADITGTGDLTLTGSDKKLISNSSSTGDYVRIYAASGTGKWDIYGNGANLRISDNDSAGKVQIDRAVLLPDNVKLEVGSGSDLQIYHDNTRSIIDAATSKNIDFYYNGSSQFWFGNAEFKGIDNKKIILGTHDDLQIYHTGSHSFIVHNGSGQFYIKTEGTNEDIVVNATRDVIIQSGQSQSAIFAKKDGAVELYYDGGTDPKFETTANGVAITGEATCSAGLFADGDLWMVDQLRHTGDTNTAIRFPAADTITAETGGSERLRIDSSGRVIIGNGTHAGGGALVVLGTTSTPNAYACASFGKVGANPTSGTTLTQLRFNGGSGAANRAAEIVVKAAGNWTEGTDQPSEMYFKVTKDGESAATERMLISETIYIGDAAENSALPTGTNHAGFAFSSDQFYTSTTGTSLNYQVRFYNGNGLVGGITTDDEATTYLESSDYRLKENEVAISDGITRLKALKPYRFNFKTNPSKTIDGFFAHEVQTVVPEAVCGTKDAVEEEDDDSRNTKAGDIIPQQIDKSKIIPLLTAALQEAIAKIETLETEVAALKAK